MPLNKAVLAAFKAASRLKPDIKQTYEAQRVAEDVMGKLSLPDPRCHIDEAVAVMHDGYEVPLRVFTPLDFDFSLDRGLKVVEDFRGTILFFHGGGWANGSVDLYIDACSTLAVKLERRVVSVDYRRSPEHRFPQAPEDCYETARQLFAGELLADVDVDNIVLFGDSAGGNLAALCAHRDRDRSLGMVNSQMLYYPALSVRETDGLKDYHFGLEDYIYDDAQSEWIVPRILAIWNAGKRSEDNYLPEGVNSRMASVSPLWDSDFSGLPRTLLITAQYDYLTSQAKTYAHYLAAAHVPVTWVNYCGVGHAFVDKCGVYPQADDSLKMAAEFVR